jgi:hypothetical protein
MVDVTATLERMYPGDQRAWFGHPVRVTVKGKAIAEPALVTST